MLVHGYPISTFKYTIRNVVEISALDNLSKGKIFKYFKIHLISSTAILLLLVLYIVLVAPSIPIEYLTFLPTPVVVGLILTVRCMLNYSNYVKFIKRMGSILGSVFTIVYFGIASIYNRVFGRPITSDLRTVVFLMAGVLLTCTFYAITLYFSVRRRVIVIEDDTGRHYAIVAADEKTARELVNIIAKEVMAVES